MAESTAEPALVHWLGCQSPLQDYELLGRMKLYEMQCMSIQGAQILEAPALNSLRVRVHEAITNQNL